jgi:hypothetical protein
MSTDEHLVDTVAYAAAAVLLGFQLLFFGVAAKAFAITEGLLPLPPVAMIRRTLPAMMCLMLAAEVCLGSFADKPFVTILANCCADK